MHSIEETKVLNKPTDAPRALGSAPTRFVMEPTAPMALRSHGFSQRFLHVELVQRHRDLDDTVAKLSEIATCDELLLARLKKRKLQVKDSIARLESELCSNARAVEDHSRVRTLPEGGPT